MRGLLHILQWRSSRSAGAPVRGSKTCGGKTWLDVNGPFDVREVLNGLFYVLRSGRDGRGAQLKQR
jgi:hypothetical protein